MENEASTSVLNLPFSNDGIYLKDCNSKIIAVCINNEVAKYLADIINSNKTVFADYTRANLYSDFIRAAYHLLLAITKANIQINTVETALLEKVFNIFAEKLNAIIKIDGVKQDGQKQETIATN